MKPTVTWVVMANSSYAEIFEVKVQNITFLERLTFAERREKMHDLVSDKTGHAYSRMGGGTGHALNDEEALRHHEESVFAHEIAQLCIKAKAEHLFDQVTLIAAPHFLGELRHVLKAKAPHFPLSKEIAKDIPERLSEAEKKAYIKEYLDL